MKDTFDTVVMQLRSPHEQADEEEEEQKIRELKDGEEDEESLLVVKTFAVTASGKSHSVPFDSVDIDPDSMCIDMTQDKNKQYMEIVDFDEHFNDVSLDWTNPTFDGN